ncbi:MAG: hypothetical protein ABS934_04610 [Psychrobacillus sp.]
MKRTVIGGFIMMGGLFTTLTIILVAMMHFPSINSWTGSKLWFVIFGNDAGLSLGFPFLVGLLFTILGLAILVMEYFDKSFL